MSPGQPKQATKQSSSTSAPKQAQKPSKQRTTPERWYTVAREEVLNGKDFMSALLAAQYSQTYARGNGQLIKQDVRYKEIKKAIVQKMTKESTWKVHNIQENARSIWEACHDEETGRPDKSLLDKALKANEQYGKTIAAFVDASITKIEHNRPLEPQEEALLGDLARQYLERKFHQNPVLEAKTEETDNEWVQVQQVQQGSRQP